jgi:hypothetical protein
MFVSGEVQESVGDDFDGLVKVSADHGTSFIRMLSYFPTRLHDPTALILLCAAGKYR